MRGILRIEDLEFDIAFDLDGDGVQGIIKFYNAVWWKSKNVRLLMRCQSITCFADARMVSRYLIGEN